MIENMIQQRAIEAGLVAEGQGYEEVIRFARLILSDALDIFYEELSIHSDYTMPLRIEKEFERFFGVELCE